ncbi:MAG: hypothetical protein VX498_05225, partial [Myxococcota bacterium]|nr:hypothetical protein [Myxococcota bacterium]
MTETDYPELLVVESEADCSVLEQLPRLPVRLQVLDAGDEESQPQPALAVSLTTLVEALGAAVGVEVRGASAEGWPGRLPSGASGRFDGLIFLAPSLPAEEVSRTEPLLGAVDSCRGLLANLGVRF